MGHLMSQITATELANKPLPASDIKHVLAAVGDAWKQLHGKNLLITGAGGFVGRWMLESIVDTTTPCYTEWVASKAETYWPREKPDYIVHATTDGIGWQHVAALARAADAKMLLLSSGAVYGQCCDAMGKPVIAQEDDFCLPTTSYGKDKLQQERVCADVAVIARLFSFVGPGLRRHTGKEFLEAAPITVTDDGAVRSYLYAADMAAWLWRALLLGKVGRTYNIGSSVPTKVVTFANLCACARGGVCYELTKGKGGTYYVPNTSRAEQELGCKQLVPLEEAIRRTLAYAKT